MPAKKRSALVEKWVALGSAYLPFADLVTDDLSLSRLLRLSLFQVSVGASLVLLVGTLNRVLIVEMGVSASLVAAILALPLLVAPLRALIGHRSDIHECNLGWRRVPFIWRGTLMQFGGFAIMPFALLVLADLGAAGNAPDWLGLAGAGLAFLLVGAGAHMVQTAGLALATALTPERSHPRVVGFLYIALLVSMTISALIYGALLADFSPGRLVQVIQGTAILCFAVNMISVWKQESRHPRGRASTSQAPREDISFAMAWRHFCTGPDRLRLLGIIGTGTLAFTMADVVLEPYGGEVLAWSVGRTTSLTAVFAIGGLAGFFFAMRRAGAGGALKAAGIGLALGLPAFAGIMIAGLIMQDALFVAGNFLLGFAGALFAHATLTAVMSGAPENKAGLALGAWGAVQATAAGLAMGASGIIRDLVASAFGDAASGYLAVYGLEIGLLLITLALAWPLITRAQQNGEASPLRAPMPSAGIN